MGIADELLRRWNGTLLIVNYRADMPCKLRNVQSWMMEGYFRVQALLAGRQGVGGMAESAMHYFLCPSRPPSSLAPETCDHWRGCGLTSTATS